MQTILGGGIRYETVELILTTIPNFQLKQKERILHLFTEIYNVFMQEIQEALDERQNQFDSLLANNQFESQIDPVDLSLKSSDRSSPVLEKRNSNQRSDVKIEAMTPLKSKSRLSKLKGKTFSADPPMRQMTMTQLFDSVDTPKVTKKSNSVKQEPSDDTLPQSLIGLAQPSNTDNEQVNNSSDFESSIFDFQSLKRKRIPSPIVNTDSPTTDEEDVQNEALLQSPSASIDHDELLYACAMCRNYWLGLPAELRQKENLTCRHRQRPAVQTPEHFWSLGIPSTQTCIERGYGGVLPPEKPIERPRRPRRQHQRRIQQHNDDHQ